MSDNNHKDDDIDEAVETEDTSVQRHDYLYETDNPNTETSEIDGSLFAPPWKQFLKEAGVSILGTLCGAIMASAFFTAICSMVAGFFPPAAAFIPLVAVVSAIGGGFFGFINADAIFEHIKKAMSDSTDLGAGIGQFFGGLFGRNDNTLSSHASMNNGLGANGDNRDQLDDQLDDQPVVQLDDQPVVQPVVQPDDHDAGQQPSSGLGI